jgi:hypothetical protein
MLNGHGQVPRFKVDQFHTDLLELGLHLGLQVLSSERTGGLLRKTMQLRKVSRCGFFEEAEIARAERP